MDELIQHCLRELSYEGEVGSNVARLREFIEFFCNRHDSSQTIDDVYCAFVWAILVQQPNVRVGVVPQWVGAEVYIAPQNSVKRKIKALGEEIIDSAPAVLQPVPDAAIRPLEELKREYGDQLRVAVDPDTIFKALTGSHIRNSKLSPMVYTALQLISRGREAGISSVDLAKKSGYDPKTCHYLVNQLLTLNLVVKRSKTNVSTSKSTIVHRDLFRRDATWQRIVEEESRAREAQKRKGKDEDSDEEEDQYDSEYTSGSTVHFDPIDERHLSSLDLIRGRIVKLLQKSPHGLHLANNLLPLLGFENPTKANRRYFIARCLNELIRQGVLEKVKVHGSSSRLVTCIRLLEEKSESHPEYDVQSSHVDAEVGNDAGQALTTNLTLHRQIIDRLDQSGVKGMTLGDICRALGGFDRRTVELLLERLHSNPPPHHLADLGIEHVVENYGRERRYRYWTIPHYRVMAAKEGFTEHPYANVDLTATGGFFSVGESQFCDDEVTLKAYIDGLRQVPNATAPGLGNSKKPRKNPVLPDGTVKRGRPPKSTAASGADQDVVTKAKISRGKKRKRTDEVADATGVEMTDEPRPKRKRGRPPKRKELEVTETSSPYTTQGAAVPASEPTPGAREQPAATNRQPKRKGATIVHCTETDGNPSVRKKRGRPRKHASLGISANDEAALKGDTEVHASARDEQSPHASDQDIQPLPAGAVNTAVTTVENLSVFRQPEEDRPAERSKDVQSRLEAGALADRSPSVDTSPLSFLVMQNPVQPTSHCPLDEEQVGSIATQQTDRQSGLTLQSASDPAVELEAMTLTLHDVPTVSGQELATPGATNRSPFVTQNDSRIPIDPALLAESSMTNTAHMGSSLEGDSEACTMVAHVLDDVAHKRVLSDTLAHTPSAKRLKSKEGPDDIDCSTHSKTRLIQARRERELLRVVKDAGGIINISSREFYDAHAALVETMSKAGEATSTRVGARMDKRTVEATLKALEARMGMKLITTCIRISTGATRPVRIACIPEISEVEIQTFLAGISIQQFPPAAPLRTLDESVIYGGANPKRLVARSSSMAQAQDDMAPDSSLRSSEANHGPLRDTIIHDKHTIAQLYGYVNGRLARARVLHHWIVNALQSDTTSTHIVSVQERVFSFSLFLNDLPISTYCAVVPSQVQEEGLLQLLRSSKERYTPIAQVPTTIRDSLQIGRWRSRGRLLGILEILCRLKVVDPLHPSNSPIPAIVLDRTTEHPSMFDVAPVETWTPLMAPGYYRLNASAPLHLWALSEDSPPFWKSIPVYPIFQCSEYWHHLQIVAQGKDAAKRIPVAELGECLTRASELGRIIRRPSSWSDGYVLSSNQETYLKQHTDLGSGDTPLQDVETDRLGSVCAAIFAPREAVVRFYENVHAKILREKAKMAKKAERRAEEARAKDAQSRVTMAQRAAEAKAQREKDWEDIVTKIHPGPLADSVATRIRRLRTRFLQSAGVNCEKWEGEIMQAIQESNFAAKQVLGTKKAPLAMTTTVPAPLPSVVAATSETSVRELIASQGPRLAPRQPVRKSKKGRGAKDDSNDVPSVPARRHRFQWNRDYDELARDASAIIRARCRGHHRTDLNALEQAFPAVHKNSVRQRIVYLRESPGADTYLQRLEDKWYDVWIQHRGTDALPDADPESPSNFDMVAHLEFLRKHVDKNALRVGFVELSQDARFALPGDVDRLNSFWEMQEKRIVTPLFDFFWSVSAEEGREKQLVQHAFTSDLQDMPPVAEYSSDNLYVADAAMKMVLGTPNELYDVKAATQLLYSVGDDLVKVATETMLSRGVLSKVVRDPSKSRPGRTLKISDSNQNAIGGPVPQDVFQDASTLVDVLSQGEDQEAWREWSLLSSDGDMAALLDLVSGNQIEFKVDTSNAQARRPAFDWNSKKADDDDIETGIMVRMMNQTEDAASAPVDQTVVKMPDVVATSLQQSAMDTPIDLALPEGMLRLDRSHVIQHGKSWDGGTAFCGQSTDGLIDCQACLQASKSALLKTVANEEAELMSRVLNGLQDAAVEGLEKTRLLRIVRHGQDSSVSETIAKITSSRNPLAYWTGYTSVVLVAAEHIRPWTVFISGADSKAMVHPRRWLDVSGRKIREVWKAALRAVTGVLLFRPGISQAEIRWRLRSVYDKQEVNDVLRYLMEQGCIERRANADVGQGADMGMPDINEEQCIFWFINGDKHWYDL